MPISIFSLMLGDERDCMFSESLNSSLDLLLIKAWYITILY